MRTDLHAALRQAVAAAPPDNPDVSSVLVAGSRRVRRRAAIRAGSAAVTVAAVVLASVVVGADRADREPRPADVVHLDLSRAGTQDLDVLASVRTTWREPMNELDHDRFDGLTVDGHVLRSRYTDDGDVHEIGLLDPETGRTDWLPPAPGPADTVVELSVERLVLFARETPRRGAVMVIDRRSEAWTRSTVRWPEGLELHVPFLLGVGLDGRLYLGSTYEGESGPLGWWSYALPEGGDGRSEPGLAGSTLAWGDGVIADADGDGRVLVTSSAGDRLVAEARPAGCETPADPALARLPVLAGLAGDRPVVTYWCGDEGQAVTLAYDADGGPAVQVSGARLLAAGADHVLLTAARSEPGGVYLLDLVRLTLARIGPPVHEQQVGLAAGLVLTNEPGPVDDRDVYDVVWKVARLPRAD